MVPFTLLRYAASKITTIYGAESEGVCKETVVAHFKMLSQNFNESEGDHGNSVRILNSGSRY
jgi:hypothetical protein